MYPKNKYIKIYMNKEELIKLRSKSENDIPITKCQTNSSHNREIKKKYSMKKRIMKNFGKYIVKLLNDNIKKINPNVKFREIKIEKFSKKEIRKFMRNNITLFCNLKLIERYKRFKKNVNQLTLNEVKSKLGKDFLNIKISSIYKECFLANLETQTIPIKQLTKKEINIEELGNCLNIGNNPYNLYKFIKKLDNNDEKNKLIKIAKTLLSKKKKINKV